MPVAIALGLFLNTPLILIVSALLHVFTAGIGGRRRNGPTTASAAFAAALSAALPAAPSAAPSAASAAASAAASSARP